MALLLFYFVVDNMACAGGPSQQFLKIASGFPCASLKFHRLNEKYNRYRSFKNDQTQKSNKMEYLQIF